jgi:ubiquinone/menaquinone biosynthesis C-methylase UbiE
MKKNLFKSTAWYYSRYRPTYSEKFIKHIAKELDLDGAGALLDLGCGNGQLAIPLAPYFEKVVAMDPASEMLAEGKRLGKKVGVKNIIWKKGGSDDLQIGVEKFRLVIIGRAFHWMMHNFACAAMLLADGDDLFHDILFQLFWMMFGF